MNYRIEKLLDLIVPCQSFADVGCDHGLIAEAVIKRSLCEKVVITDVSEKCLNKARMLLSKFIDEGLVESFVADGLTGVPYCEQVLIAGMGGEEIVKIIDEAPFLPERFVLQPMKNTVKLRKTLLKKGYRIERDFVFYSGRKYYDTVVAVKGKDFLSEDELKFGRTNLKERSADFIRRLKEERDKLNGILLGRNLSENDKQKFEKEINEIERYLQPD